MEEGFPANSALLLCFLLGCPPPCRLKCSLLQEALLDTPFSLLPPPRSTHPQSQLPAFHAFILSDPSSMALTPENRFPITRKDPDQVRLPLGFGKAGQGYCRT